LIPSNQYIKHLQSQHYCKEGGERNQSTAINTDYFEQNGETFLQKWQFEDNFYYTWICMLNSTEESRETLAVHISVFSETSKYYTKFSSTMLGVHDATRSLQDIKASGQFMALHSSQLLALRHGGCLFWNSVVEFCQKTSSTHTNDDDNDDDDNDDDDDDNDDDED